MSMDREQGLGPANDNVVAGDQARSSALEPLGEDLHLLKCEALRALRRAILMELRQGARCCGDRTETPFEARQRFARLTEVARNVERLATAGVVLVRAPLA